MIEVIRPGSIMHHVMLGKEVQVIAATIVCGGGVQYTAVWYDEDGMRREDVVQGCELSDPERGEIVKVIYN